MKENTTRTNVKKGRNPKSEYLKRNCPHIKNTKKPQGHFLIKFIQLKERRGIQVKKELERLTIRQ